jgi:carboxypeptidase C (cathepsin A)
LPRRAFRGWRRAVVAAAALSLAAGAALADPNDKPPAPTNALPARVETHHTITLQGRPLDYRAVAETIALTNRKGEPAASIYTVSYLADTPEGARRPVAFVFNGGPGAASVFLHLGGLGPRILDTPATGAVPPPPVHLVDNPSTWLPFTDLVFIDPVGTGFSRGEGKGDNPDKGFWNVDSDLNSLDAVVRRWLTRQERWSSPVFLVGESYGGLRAAAMASRLAGEVGVTVSGLVLVSPALDTALLHPDVSNTLAPAFELPSYAAAAAAFSGKATPVEAAEGAAGFALSDYLVGLTALRGIPSKDDPFIARVARLIGLPDEAVRQDRGRVPSHVFARELRRPEGEIVSVYDATVARPTEANPRADNAGDPVLDAATAAYTAAFDIYAPAALGYHTEQPYHVLAHEVAQQWNWDQAGGGGLGIALSSLRDALLARPATRVLIVNGRYDLVTPYLASRWLVDQLGIPDRLRAQIRLRVYEGGHMMYMRPASRAALTADAAELFGAAGNAPPQ